MNKWYEIAVKIQLPMSENYSFSTTFVNSDDIRFWRMAGLSTDSVSVDNYTIIFKTIQTPLVIDPQGKNLFICLKNHFINLS